MTRPGAVQFVSMTAALVSCLLTCALAQQIRQDQPSRRDPVRQDLARKLGDDHSWTIMAYEPVASALREIALAQSRARIEVADDVLRLVARSADAAAAAVREQSRGMVAFRSREAGYAYSRPRDWRESETTDEALREERIQSGELFIAPDATAFLSSAYRRFIADYDGYVPVSGLTPAVLIEKLLGKLRRLPGVHEARAIRHTEISKDGVERIEVELELSFRPAANEPAVPFVGQALVLRNARGIFELIGLRSQIDSANAAGIIERSIRSATVIGVR